MPDQRPKIAAKDSIKRALTPQRLTILSWAFAAVLFGSIGFSSFQFSHDGFTIDVAGLQRTVLPPSGDVDSTASIGGNGRNGSIALMPTSNGRILTEDDQIKAGELETLRREIVALRRRLSALTEQNISYSRRIAALEQKQVLEVGGGSNTPKPQPVPSQAKPDMAGNLETPTTAPSVQRRIEAVPAPETQPELYNTVKRQLSHSGQNALADLRNVEAPERDYQPVRLVELPTKSDELITTGSIAPAETPEPLKKPSLIQPSQPVGRSSGAGQSMIQHSDFGVIVGQYATMTEAGEAWLRFSEQNEERMRGLRPIVSASELNGGGYNLLAGPFGNAADAAVACLRLLEITGTCHPALFIGDELPEVDVTQR